MSILRAVSFVIRSSFSYMSLDFNFYFSFNFFASHDRLIDLLFFSNNFRMLEMKTTQVNRNKTTDAKTNAIMVNASGSFRSRIWFSRSKTCSSKVCVPFGTGHGCWIMISWRWTWKQIENQWIGRNKNSKSIENLHVCFGTIVGRLYWQVSLD